MLKKICLLFSASIPIASCSVFTSHDVDIANQSDGPITDIQFAYADAVFSRSKLDPGEVFSFEANPDTDGGISLSYVFRGEEIEHQLGYATPMASMKCDIAVAGEGVLGGCEQA